MWLLFYNDIYRYCCYSDTIQTQMMINEIIHNSHSKQGTNQISILTTQINYN